ncbi:MAG: hypothetical protein AAF433_09245 [Bacteroidota bacterium]
MSSYNYDRPEQSQEYSGQPVKQDAQELPRWKRFLALFVPGIKREFKEKKLLGDQYLEAKVRTQQAIASEHAASAEVKLAEADKIRAEAEAQRIANETARMSQAKIAAASAQQNGPLSEEEFNAELAKLASLANMLKLQYGMEVDLNSKTETQLKKEGSVNEARYPLERDWSSVTIKPDEEEPTKEDSDFTSPPPSSIPTG